MTGVDSPSSATTDADSGRLARSAAAAWEGLVTTAVLGTDRRPLPDALDGWDAWSRHPDPAVQLLDRAAAVATARRAGILPGARPEALAPGAPFDDRSPPPATATMLLQRMIAGEHDVLMPEWFQRCEAGGFRLPPIVLPALLLRARRSPAMDTVVRRLAGDRARWLAEAVPELGVRAEPVSGTGDSSVFERPVQPGDSNAVVAGIVGAFAEGAATWAVSPQLRQATIAVDPDVLPGLCESLVRAPFFSVTERTRIEILRLAEFRRDMVRSFGVVVGAASAGRPAP